MNPSPPKKDVVLHEGRMICYLQRNVLVDPADYGLVVASVSLRPKVIDFEFIAQHINEFFVVPSTPKDNVFWMNGLDGKEHLAEAFLLFRSVAEAKSIILANCKILSATFYMVTDLTYDGQPVAWLKPVAEIKNPYLREFRILPRPNAAKT